MEPKQQPPYPLRMPPELRLKLEQEAESARRSLNAEIIDRLQNEEDPDILLGWLKTDCGLDDDKAVAVAKANLPEGHGRFGETATRRHPQSGG